MANWRPFIIAIAFGLIAVVLVWLYVQKVQSDAATKEVEMGRVVRATTIIPPRTTITEHMLEEIEVLAETVAPDTVTELEEIIGQVSYTNILEGQILMHQMFREETALADISRMLKPGERAVTVGVTEVSGLGGNLQPGDNVDVLVTVLSHDEVGVSSTFTVLRNIDVMAVGQDIGFEEDENGDAGSISKSVTLKVDTMQAERLALASEVGSLRLVLRNPDDEFAPATDGTVLTEFVQYTPTRKELEEAERRARADAEETTEREHARRLAEIQAWAATGTPVTPEDFGSDIIELPPVGPSPIVVEVILGGESHLVELERTEWN